MADSMPAVSAQTPLQPGASHGSALVSPAAPIEASAPAMPGPAPQTSDGIRSPGGQGSSLTMGWAGMNLSPGVHNGGQQQGQRSNAAWPAPRQDQGSSGDAPSGATDMDVRVIDVPSSPGCGQSNGSWTIGDGDR